MPNWIRFPLVLAIIGIISAASLASLYSVTEVKKQAIAAEKTKNALRWVIPNAADFKSVKSSQTNRTLFFKALDTNKELIGYAAEAAASGYAGPVKVMVGVNTNYEILGTKVLSHNETPGLGDKIEEILSKKTWQTVITNTSPDESKLRPYFQVQFLNQTYPVKLKRNGGTIEAITGATISSRAVVNAVNKVIEELKK